MASEDELKDIKQILAQIRDQGQTTAGTGSQSSKDLGQYTRELKLARDELSLLDKGSGEYNRKLREVEKLTRQTRNAMKDQRRETDLLTLSMEGVSGAMDMFGNAIDKVIVKFGGLVKAVFDEAKQLDTLTMEFRAATGASAAMASNIGALTDRMRMYGISNEKAAKTAKTLYDNMTLFSQMSITQQNSLTPVVGLLDGLGVSGEKSAKILDTSFRAMNMSTTESTQLLMDLRGTARALQVPVEQLSSDFLTAEARIVQLGKNGPEAFKKLSAQAKGTGISVDGLLGIVQQFDTFEGASKIASELGAILGTSFDFMAMMQMEDPADQVDYLKDSLSRAGLTADEFMNSNRQAKLALSKAFGTDTTTMMKLLNGEFDELTEAAVEATYTFAEMKDEAFALKGFDQIVNDTMNSLKRPIGQIQEATRATFASFKPLIGRFEKFNKNLIESTGRFVKRNSELVGAVGILYNLANIDGVQQGYELFKGIAGFTGDVMGNLFSVKGLLVAMAGGAVYLLREQIGDIYKILKTDGPVAAIKAIGTALKDVFNEYKQKAIDMGFDKTFFDALKTKFKTFAITTYHTFRDEWLKPMFRTLQVEMIYHFERMKSDGTFEKMGNMLADAIGSAVSAALRQIPGLGAMLRGKDWLGEKWDDMFGDDPVTPDRGRARTRTEIRSDLSAMTPEQHKRALAGRREVINSVINDKLATIQLQNTKGMQTVNNVSAAAMKGINDSTDKIVTTLDPHIQKLGTTIESMTEATKKASESALAEGIKIGREMESAKTQAHDDYKSRPIVLVADGRQIASIVDPIAQKAVGSKLRGR